MKKVNVSMAAEPTDSMVRDWLTERIIGAVTGPHGKVELTPTEYKDNRWAEIRESYEYSWIQYHGMPEPVLVIAPTLGGCLICTTMARRLVLNRTKDSIDKTPGNKGFYFSVCRSLKPLYIETILQGKSLTRSRR